MKTETTDADPETSHPMNTDTATLPSIPAPSQAPVPAAANAERLAELAAKIRAAYEDEGKASSMVVDWQKKQLTAGIQIGEYLIEAKSLLPVKGFIRWCGENFPDLAQRTLNRYMKIARNKCETHVSNAGGLRQAYVGCSRDKTDSPQESQVEKKLSSVKRHLNQAKEILNSHPDVISSPIADEICESVDALNVWATDYRARTAHRSLNKLRDAEFEMSLTEKAPSPAAAEKADYATAE